MRNALAYLALIMFATVTPVASQVTTFPLSDAERFCRARHGENHTRRLDCVDRQREHFHAWRGMWNSNAGFVEPLRSFYLACERNEHPYWDSVQRCAERQLAAWTRSRALTREIFALPIPPSESENLVLICTLYAQLRGDLRELQDCLTTELTPGRHPRR